MTVAEIALQEHVSVKTLYIWLIVNFEPYRSWLWQAETKLPAARQVADFPR